MHGLVHRNVEILIVQLSNTTTSSPQTYAYQTSQKSVNIVNVSQE
jgi:hypothetical protein